MAKKGKSQRGLRKKGSATAPDTSQRARNGVVLSVMPARTESMRLAGSRASLPTYARTTFQSAGLGGQKQGAGTKNSRRISRN